MAQDAAAIAANYRAAPICRRTASSELRAVGAYRHDEGQEVPRQGGHGRRLASNGRTVHRSPCSVAPMPVGAPTDLNAASECYARFRDLFIRYFMFEYA